MTAPTPPDRARRARRGRASAPRRSRPRSIAAVLEALAAACPDTTTDRRRGPRPAGTGGRWRCTGRWPGRWARWRRWCAGRPTPPRSPRCSACATSTACRSPPPVAAAACAAPASPATAACCWTSPRMAGVVAVDDESLTVDVLPGTFGPDLEADLRAARPDRSGTGRSRWTSPPSAAGWPAGERASTPPATARSRTWSSASTSSWPTAAWSSTGGAPRAAVGPGPDPALRRVRRHAGDHHRGPPARASRPVRPSAGRRSASPRWDAGVEACRRILRRGATPAVLRLYDADRVPAQPRHRRLASPCSSCWTRPIPRSPTPRWRSWPKSARRATPLDEALVERWLEHRNDVSALEALTRKGFVVDTLEIAGPWSRPPGDLPRRHRRAAGRPPRPGGQRPPLAQLPRRRLPVLHLRRHAPGRRDRGDLRRAVGRRDRARCWRRAAT